MTETAQDLENEVEASRLRIESTVGALKDRMSLGQLVDESMAFMKGHGGGEMISNLGAQVRGNPLPVALVGLGVAWLMMGGRTGGTTTTGTAASVGMNQQSALGGAISGFGSEIGDMAASAGDAMSSAASGVGDLMSNAADGIRREMHDARDAAASAVGGIKSSAQSAIGQGNELGQKLMHVMSDEPLILGAIGVALGAALGAAFPATAVEDKLMGETRDKLLDDVKELGAEGYEKAKEVATEAYDDVRAHLQGNGVDEDTTRALH